MSDPLDSEAETRAERVQKVLLDELHASVTEMRGSWEEATEEEERGAIRTMRERSPENWVKQVFADVWEEDVNREYWR
jgi:hypothetical protein